MSMKIYRGEWGGEMIEVNSLGKFQRSLGIKPAKKGNDIQLTIDEFAISCRRSS